MIPTPRRTGKSVTITAGESLSPALQVGTGIPLALLTPATLVTTTMSFQGSLDGSTWLNLYDAGGVEVTMTIGTSRAISLEAIYLAGMQFLKLRLGTAGSPATEAADRIFTVVTR
jgi:hypothetical protein